VVGSVSVRWVKYRKSFCPLAIANFRPLRSPSSIGPTIIRKMPELTPPAEITSNSLCSDRSDLAAAATASAIAAAVVIASMLLISLSTWPWPGGPT
jgi:hypothetical protein